jgi:hypothetical protein
VAAAEYVRALYAPVRPKITFAGGCPGARHASIDVTLSVKELLGSLEERGISARQQPTEFDSVIPPDRRRFYSDAGGIPARQPLRQLPGGIDLVELRGEDVVVDLAQELLQKEHVLIDVALPLGCSCSGIVAGVTADAARARVREMEPPRALSPVVDHSLRLSLDAASLPPAVRAPQTFSWPSPRPTQPESGTPTPEEALPAIEIYSRRRSPPGMARPVLGTMPLARTETGRSLPRAYVARRRSSPTGVRRIEPSARTTRGISEDWRRWAVVATVGLLLGLVVAWLIRLLS